MFDDITPEKVLKATLIGAGVCAAAVAAPIGIVGVIGVTAAGVAASWAVDSVGEEVKDEEKSDS